MATSVLLLLKFLLESLVGVSSVRGLLVVDSGLVRERLVEVRKRRGSSAV